MFGIDGVYSIVERSCSLHSTKACLRGITELCKEFELYEEKISGTFSILNKPALKELNPSLIKKKSQAAFNEPIQLVDDLKKRTRKSDKHEYLQILSARLLWSLSRRWSSYSFEGLWQWGYRWSLLGPEPVRVWRLTKRLKETTRNIWASLKMPDKPSFSTKYSDTGRTYRRLTIYPK